MDSIDEDTAALLRKRVYDMAGTVRDVKVFLNDERVKVKNFKQYVEMSSQFGSSGGGRQVRWRRSVEADSDIRTD